MQEDDACSSILQNSTFESSAVSYVPHPLSYCVLGLTAVYQNRNNSYFPGQVTYLPPSPLVRCVCVISGGVLLTGRCKDCTPQQTDKLTCCVCTKTMPLKAFAKAQRKHVEKAVPPPVLPPSPVPPCCPSRRASVYLVMAAGVDIRGVLLV